MLKIHRAVGALAPTSLQFWGVPERGKTHRKLENWGFFVKGFPKIPVVDALPRHGSSCWWEILLALRSEAASTATEMNESAEFEQPGAMFSFQCWFCKDIIISIIHSNFISCCTHYITVSYCISFRAWKPDVCWNSPVFIWWGWSYLMGGLGE